MYSLTKIIKAISLIGAFLLAVTIARAVDLPPDGSYPNQNTAEGEDAVLSASQRALTIRRWGLMRSTPTQPILITPWRVGSGGPQAGSTPRALVTRRRCY